MGKRMNKITLEIVTIAQGSGNGHDGIYLKHTRKNKLKEVDDFTKYREKSQRF